MPIIETPSACSRHIQGASQTMSHDAARPLSFHIQNLGCKVNRVEADAIAAQLIASGAQPECEDAASVIVINTCTVTAQADKKARKAVRHALSARSAPMVVVTGCAIAIDPDAFAALGPRVVVEADRLAVPMRVADLLGMDMHPISSSIDVDMRESPMSPLREGKGFPTRMGVKVQDGCDNACTYCIVHVARGPAVSRDITSVLDEVRRASDAGVREVVLTGINLGRYRAPTSASSKMPRPSQGPCDSEVSGDIDLAGLITLLLENTDIARVRLSSVEPPDMTPRLIETIAAGGMRIARHLHLPLQSGCDRTLVQMGRGYSISDYADAVSQIRSSMPDVALTTDVIAGFPGETDLDFSTSLDFCRRMHFAKIHVFRYSPRIGTPAAMRDDQVAAEIASSRAAQLRSLSIRMRADDTCSRIGRLEWVLIERRGMGTSDSYHDVEVRGSDELIGQLVPVRLLKVLSSGALLGEVESSTPRGDSVASE